MTAKRPWMPSGPAPRRRMPALKWRPAPTRATFGGLIAMENLINGSTPPSVVSISYGDCEADNGETANAAFSAIYQQAVAEGISVFVAAGDEGAASCDAGATEATHGIGVSGYASRLITWPWVAPISAICMPER